MTHETIDLAAVRERLKAGSAREFWRSLDELAGTRAFQQLVDREFPQGASEMRDPVTRRKFLTLMGASLALGGLSGCQFALKQPQEKIVPYVRQPELVIPGKPLHFATAMTVGGFGVGLVAESHEGRPTKLEGNPDHPASLGSSDILAQAAILNLYDPDRSTGVTAGGAASSWADFVAAAAPLFAAQAARQGAGLRILSGTVTSPTLVAQIQAILAAHPQARWVQYDPNNRDQTLAGAQLAFGAPLTALYRYNYADVVVALDADILSEPGVGVRHAREFAEKRRVSKANKQSNRVYVAEPTPSTTGFMADHRLAVRSALVESLARALARELGVAGVAAEATLEAPHQAWVRAAAADLRAAAGRSIVAVGESQPAIVHAIGHAINAALGNHGKTISFIDPVEPAPGGQLAALQQLVADLKGGAVELLLILESNPVVSAPAELGVAAALPMAGTSIHLGLYADETAALASWHVNAAHFLESWSDARAFDGTASIVQPLIAPLYDGRSAHELLEALTGASPARTGYQIVSEYWQAQGGANFQAFWQQVLNRGVIANTSAATRRVAVTGDLGAAPSASSDDIELVFRPDPSLSADPVYGNNAWLHELPRPFTKLVWDNVAMLSPRTAELLRLASGDVVQLALGGRTVDAPVFVQPGQADDVVTVHLGYGRTRAGRVGSPDGATVGFDANLLRSTGALWFAAGVTISPLGRTHQLVSTQGHFAMEGRDKDLVQHGTVAEFIADEEFLHHGAHHEVLPLFPLYDYSLEAQRAARTSGHAWGMSIDLNVCTGCNACVVACQAENNIPVVGKEQVALGREMHWIRIDQYFSGDLDNPAVYNMVMLCQQCENAPCEIVCPVAATVHDSEGLNNMVYNRCVGTKYCSNNCPYKVRRFNFLQYVDETTPSLKLQRNPDVTVRARGVMEKCTFCVQRINEARIDSQRLGQPIVDGSIVTACQQACPTQAIVFGDLNDPSARVSALKQEPLKYTSLDILNTRPRVSYLAKLSNPNAELGGEA
jgi:molybdopterin-containing oxidoreductase family iron-sulfur binding subunit